jgi:hypothetical protein
MKKSLFALAAMAAMGDTALACSARVSCDAESGHMKRALAQGGLMANIDATDLKTANYHMQAYGNESVYQGKVALTVNPTAADVIRLMRIPAGAEINEIVTANDDLDSNGSPTIVVGIGFEPVDATDGPTADYAYFAAAGQTTLQAASSGAVWRKFAPKKFEKDVYMCMKVGTASATFAAGTIYASARGRTVGIK